jgi:hypothetical protein
MGSGWHDRRVVASARRRGLAVLLAAALLTVVGCGEDLVVTGDAPTAATTSEHGTTA